VSDPFFLPAAVKNKGDRPGGLSYLAFERYYLVAKDEQQERFEKRHEKGVRRI